MAEGAAPVPKQDELVPHLVKDQLPHVSYCITNPPPWHRDSVPRFAKFRLEELGVATDGFSPNQIISEHGDREGPQRRLPRPPPPHRGLPLDLPLALPLDRAGRRRRGRGEVGAGGTPPSDLDRAGEHVELVDGGAVVKHADDVVELVMDHGEVSLEAGEVGALSAATSGEGRGDGKMGEEGEEEELARPFPHGSAPRTPERRCGGK